MKFQNKFVNLLIMSFLLLLAMAACTPSGSAGDVEPDVESGASLEGTSWVLDEFGPENELTAVLPNTPITLNFADGGINGAAGCNSYFAEVTFEGDGTLSVGLVGSTLMACLDEEVMQQESDFLAMLAEVTGYTLRGNRLTLHTENGSLAFVAATMHETDGEGAEVVDWETAVSILNSGEVVEIFFTTQHADYWLSQARPLADTADMAKPPDRSAAGEGDSSP